MAEGMVTDKVAGFNSEVKTCSHNTQEGHGCIRMPSKLEDEVSGADLYSSMWEFASEAWDRTSTVLSRNVLNKGAQINSTRERGILYSHV